MVKAGPKGFSTDSQSESKRFWVETLQSIMDKKINRSFPLNPPQFPKAFELNDDNDVTK